MCGINGIFAYRAGAPLPGEADCLAVRDAMRTRGPDGKGFYRDASGRCLLGHRRLAIIDLSEAGIQPMSAGGLTITFNGEIYNYRALREELELGGARFKTATDTEVLLQLFLRDGPEMVHRLRGMFAFAIWDSRVETLFLARDPHGIKPLYYSDDGKRFRFASSVRALCRDGGISRDVEPAALLGFLAWGSVPEPLTMYRAVRALPAGSTLTVTPAGVRGPQCYWAVPEVYSKASPFESPSGLRATNHLPGAFLHAECRPQPAAIRDALLDSVRAHLVADVPVGVFLSSGIDSAVLLALAAEVHSAPLRAVTLAFAEFKGTPQDEAPLAREVASRYGAEHSVVELSAEVVRASMQDFLSAMDQPSVDGLNTYWVSKAAHESGLKAVLSGLGGDELVGGYASFRLYPRLRRLALARRIPGFAEGTNLLGRFVPGRRESKLRRLGSALASRASTFQLIRGLFTPEEIRELVHPDIWEAGHGVTGIMSTVERALKNVQLDAVQEVAIAEQCTYMRNQLLRDADWASMKHSLEVRLPLVDRPLTESLGPALVRARSGGKRMLAQALRKPLPDSVLRRRKTGFALPMQQWIAEDIGTGSQLSPPRELLHPDGREVVDRIYAGVPTARTHWSRPWALHCLASWLAMT